MSNLRSFREWDGTVAYRAIEKAQRRPGVGVQRGQMSGLLFLHVGPASMPSRDRDIQGEDETPRQFWQRMIEKYGPTICKCCGGTGFVSDETAKEAQG